MSFSRKLFSSASVHWATPSEVYDELNKEFDFNFDPCPLSVAPVINGLEVSWAGKRVYCNPPYGRGTGDWLKKAEEAEIAVFLLPSRTDTQWWHEYAMKATEIRFLKGRLKFGNATTGAPFPSVILIYK